MLRYRAFHIDATRLPPPNGLTRGHQHTHHLPPRNAPGPGPYPASFWPPASLFFMSLISLPAPVGFCSEGAHAPFSLPLLPHFQISIPTPFPPPQDFAQKALVAYLRSVFLQPNKAVFDVAKLPVEDFAASMGLASVPKLRFLKKVSVGRCVQCRFVQCIMCPSCGSSRRCGVAGVVHVCGVGAQEVVAMLRLWGGQMGV